MTVRELRGRARLCDEAAHLRVRQIARRLERVNPHVARERPRAGARVDLLARHVDRRQLDACRQTRLLGLRLDGGRRHVGRAHDLLELEAVTYGAPTVDTHDDCCDAECHEDCRGDDASDFEHLAHLELLPSRPRLLVRALDLCAQLRRPGTTLHRGVC